MKCITPEISWHNRDPVLSVDIQSGLYENLKGETFWRVATGGADCHVLIWHLTTTKYGGATVNFAADLDRHQRAVNAVRFSSSREILASGDDESIIILWKVKEGRDFSPPSGDTENKEQWTSWKVLKGHIEDIYDISWSPDSNFLISGSVDNTAILWDIQKGRKTAILQDHKGFVQGVSWDPCNQYVCTISTDRYCRLISIATKKVVQRVYKSKIPTPSGSSLQGKLVRLFYDDTFKSFFRRLTFSIDGSLIFVPSGIIELQETTETISNAVIVFSRKDIREPIMILPTLNECTIAVRCCPVYFELRQDSPDTLVSLPYRMVFAVATQSSILLYDTQQTSPIGVVSLIHYGRLNDLSWSSDGKILITSSSDGYCSIIHFEEGELGEVYKMKKNSLQESTIIKEASKNSNKKSLYSTIKDKNNVSTFDVDDCAMDVELIESSTLNAVTNNRSEELNAQKPDEIIISENNLQINKKLNEEETEDIKLVYNEENSNNATKIKTRNTPPKSDAPIICHKTPRRVKLITLSSPKGLKKQ
ncbi:PREDICTED: chromatin assembly factor 1 subunit B isoform X2 [Trachymyrmex cornetzi]|uniref:Chromatin assembly factor 1 subunit B n=1 Tax=Trachymyrmex cornetzi TaxID=471704 RepID=A0A151ITD1_9HYME|nr:PREDICTED: chromatin assembly factor 1 subunit B isoform X2 [Trachymyrmex cornetzi]KYN10274.1 Chromatin assembly factor 1 subunit B [Trachymyrmex cornetzi]